MKDRYFFPAIFTAEEETGWISIEFPDLPGALTCGKSLEEAYHMANECMSLHLYGMEEDNYFIPEPSDIKDLILEKNQYIAMVEAWMPPFRYEMKHQDSNKTVNKTLTIPGWLNKLGIENEVNFSYILKNALMDYLGVYENKLKK